MNHIEINKTKLKCNIRRPSVKVSNCIYFLYCITNPKQIKEIVLLLEQVNKLK